MRTWLAVLAGALVLITNSPAVAQSSDPSAGASPTGTTLGAGVGPALDAAIGSVGGGTGSSSGGGTYGVGAPSGRGSGSGGQRYRGPIGASAPAAPTGPTAPTGPSAPKTPTAPTAPTAATRPTGPTAPSRVSVDNSSTTVQNAVGNLGNVGSTAAVNTKGNTNQNNNQSFNSNAISQGQGLTVGIGSISFPSAGGGAGAAGAGAGGAAAPAAAGDPAGGAGATPSYSGEVQFASPNQAITFGNSQVTNISTNLPQLPGIPGSPGNFSQPYKPDVFINGAGPVRPGKLTWDQAKDCRGGWGFKDNFVGGSRGRVNEITLVYAAWDKITIVNDISSYVGISSVEGADRPWLPAVCEAAFHAMSKGVNYGIVEFIVRPKNTMKGFGVGSSAGGSGTPSVLTTGPYALAGALGFGMGWSSQRVEGEVMIQITGLRLAQIPVSEAPAEQPVAEKQHPAAGAAQQPAAGSAPQPPAGSAQPNAAQPSAGTAPAQPAAATSAPQPAAGTPAAGTAQPPQPTTGTTAGPTTGTTAQPAATPPTAASPLDETTKFIKTNGTPLPLRIPSSSTQ